MPWLASLAGAFPDRTDARSAGLDHPFIELQKALNLPGEIRIERFGWTFCPGDKVMPTDLVGKLLAEFAYPLPYSFVATMMPRAVSNSSSMRRPSGKRKYSHTAWPMISAAE